MATRHLELTLIFPGDTGTELAPVVKWISRRSPEPEVQVRFLAGALHTPKRLGNSGRH